jgi:hypothetical protein
MINVISVILMGFSEHFLIWSVLRIIAGITSGTIPTALYKIPEILCLLAILNASNATFDATTKIVPLFVVASNVALEALRMANKQSISGILYSAVGIGISTRKYSYSYCTI